jgi:peptide/nickel transport system substrate-binding protein
MPTVVSSTRNRVCISAFVIFSAIAVSFQTASSVEAVTKTTKKVAKTTKKATAKTVATTTKQTVTTKVAVTTLATTTTPAPAAGGVKQGGDIVVGTAGELASFDPAKLSSVGTLAHPVTAIYDTLLRPTDNGQIRPNLAKSMKPNSDLTVWTMVLNKGVQFSDGSPLDANAVKVNIDRHINPATRSQGAFLLSGVRSVTVMDDVTVRFDLSSPNVSFDWTFTLQPGFIAAPSTLAAGYDLDSKPVGAGPFMLQSWQRDSQMVVVRNPKYWQKDRPFLDKVTFRPIVDPITRLGSLRSNDIQLSTFIDQGSLVNAAGVSSLGVESGSGNGGDVFYMNMRKTPFNDIRVRRALAMGLDLEAMSKALYGGSMSKALGPFADDSPYFLKDNGYPAFDPAGAAALIRAYKAETGRDVKFGIMANNAPDRVQLAQFVQSQWKAIGADPSIDITDAASTSARFASFSFDIAVRALPEFADPEPFLSRWFYGNSPQNYAGINSAQLDAAFDRGRSIANPAVRAVAYQDVSRFLGQLVPVLWWTHGIRGSAHTKTISLGPDNSSQNVLWYSDIGLTGK